MYKASNTLQPSVYFHFLFQLGGKVFNFFGDYNKYFIADNGRVTGMFPVLDGTYFTAITDVNLLRT
jgi:hypothetical protein